MRPIGRSLLLAFVAALALGAVSVSTAAATELPTFVHCIKQTGGKFEAGCEKEKAGGGFEKAEVSSATSFTASGGEVTLQGETLLFTCEASTMEGQITGAKTVGKVLTKLTGCEIPGLNSSCNTGANPAGEIRLNELQGELGYTNKSTKAVGLDLKPASGELLVTFNCPGELINIKIKGSIIGRTIQTNKISKTGVLQYKASGSKQEFTKFEGGATDALEISANESIFGKAAEAAEYKITYSEGIEVKA
jgi:hypothetical protein